MTWLFPTASVKHKNPAENWDLERVLTVTENNHVLDYSS